MSCAKGKSSQSATSNSPSSLHKPKRPWGDALGRCRFGGRSVSLSLSHAPTSSLVYESMLLGESYGGAAVWATGRAVMSSEQRVRSDERRVMRGEWVEKSDECCSLPTIHFPLPTTPHLLFHLPRRPVPARFPVAPASGARRVRSSEEGGIRIRPWADPCHATKTRP